MFLLPEVGDCYCYSFLLSGVEFIHVHTYLLFIVLCLPTYVETFSGRKIYMERNMEINVTKFFPQSSVELIEGRKVRVYLLNLRLLIRSLILDFEFPVQFFFDEFRNIQFYL